MTEKKHTNGESDQVDLPAMKFTIEEVPKGRLAIKVIGIGGCGGNIVNHMIEKGIEGVEFACLNTDEQALNSCRAPTKLLIGSRVTQGYGTGSNPEVGREAALENTEEVTELLEGTDLAFLAVGLGGGTGTGATPVIAQLAKQMGALTVAAVVKPFAFEGKHRNGVADEGVETVLSQADTAIVIPNEQLLEHAEVGSGFFDGFGMAVERVREAVQGINDIILKPGIMNADFADIRVVLQDAGLAAIGSAERSGRDAAMQAARDAISSPTMKNEGLRFARKVLVNITGSAQFGIHDASEAFQLIQREVASDANLIIGTVQDDSMAEFVRVMVLASGFASETFRLESPADVSEPHQQLSADEPSWDSEPTVEVGDPSLAEPQPVAKPLVQAAADDGQAAAPALDDRMPNGRPLEFMPPPKIQDQDSDYDEGESQKPAFFRRRSIFR
ncbi:MAG: cell division protein FtsZ [Bryobacterales bacterium]|nr:cell division protein FtsZ [Bryobacterales bacterium]